MITRRKVAGLHAVESALLNSPEKIVNVWLDQKKISDSRFLALAEKLQALGVKVQPTARQRLEALAEGQSHQGVVLEMVVTAGLADNDLRDALENAGKNPLFLVLDHVQDPHNLGACLRTADAAGVKGVIVTRDQSAGLTPAVAKVASGAAETMPLYTVTNLARALGWFKESGLWVAGTAGEASKTVYEADLSVPLVVVMGAEGKGLRRLTRDTCDFLVKIPMTGQVESLNLSVATGIVLFEAVRQRQMAKTA